MNTGGRKRVYLRETLLALLVVALTFLNYGHVSVSAAGGVQITPDSWCGDPRLPDSPDHSPCHACRIGSGADLPPLPACIKSVNFGATTIAYAAPLATIELPHKARPAQARGPPSLV